MKRGDRVIAEWPYEDGWWYAGVICNAEGGGLEVQYDDCQRADLTPSQVRPLNVGVGSRVHVRWRGGDAYYPGQVTAAEGNALYVEYDDGDVEWAIVSAMRMHVDDL